MLRREPKTLGKGDEKVRDERVGRERKRGGSVEKRPRGPGKVAVKKVRGGRLEARGRKQTLGAGRASKGYRLEKKSHQLTSRKDPAWGGTEKKGVAGKEREAKGKK